MLKLDRLCKGQEYYFVLQNYICAGFFIHAKENMAYIKNGHFCFIRNANIQSDENIFAFKEATIDTNQVIAFASM